MEMTELAKNCLENAKARYSHRQYVPGKKDPARYDAMADRLLVDSEIRVQKRGQRDAWKIRRALAFRGIDVTVRTWNRSFMLVRKIV